MEPDTFLAAIAPQLDQLVDALYARATPEHAIESPWTEAPPGWYWNQLIRGYGHQRSILLIDPDYRILVTKHERSGVWTGTTATYRPTTRKHPFNFGILPGHSWLSAPGGVPVEVLSDGAAAIFTDAVARLLALAPLA